MDSKNEVLGRVYLIGLIVAIVAIAIFSRAAWINVVEGDRWVAKGDSLYVKHVPIQAERGNILADKGSLLASAQPFFDIRFDPNSTGMSDQDFFKAIDSLALCLATYVDITMTAEEHKLRLLRARQGGEHYMLIARGVSHQEMTRITNFPLFRKGQYKGGLIIERKSKRRRPFGILANRTIGYVRENAQPVGLEGYYDKALSGKEGTRLMKRAGKYYIPVGNLAEIPPVTGNDLRTTLNVNIQDIAETALINGIEKHNADYGCAVVMEVATGAIKAIANVKATENGYWESYNYAVGTAVEQGSTFKLASIMTLLEDRKVQLDDLVNIENGKTQFFEQEMVDASLACHELDTTTVRRVFELSSNVGIAKLIQQHYGRGTQAKQFIKGLRALGIGEVTGIGIEGEASPYIKEAFNEEDDWSGLSLPWMSIGYESMMTPLQMLTFYNGVANNGKIMKPYLVSSIESYGEVIEEYKPLVIKERMASPYTIQLAQDLLKGVVQNGTASKLQTEGFTFSGKTGTAQTNYSLAENSGALKYRASFCGYFPADNPKYSVIVLIENPKQAGIYGSQVAGPVFKKIAEEIFDSEMDLHEAMNEKQFVEMGTRGLRGKDIGAKEDFEKIVKQLKLPLAKSGSNKWVALKARRDTVMLYPRVFSEELVPDVRGMGLRDATHILEERGLKIKRSGVGKVLHQSVRQGTPARGQTVYLKLK